MIICGLLIIAGAIGLWLCLWDLIDFLTNGLNNGIWNVDILINGAPSIGAGIVIIIIVGVLGYKVLK